MLPPGLWQDYEPRAMLPIFSDVQNFVDFVVQPSLTPTLRGHVQPLYWLFKRRKTAGSVLRDYVNLALRRRLDLRGAFITREGRYVCTVQLARDLGVGDFFSSNVNELLAGVGVPMQDGLLVLIANRGRTDLWNSSPGSPNVRYVGRDVVAGYRTGLFARPLNPVAGKKHFGFTGLNPQIRVKGPERPAVLLINHSSDPHYDRVVTPVIRLHRSRDEYLEQPFGAIAPHGALERGIAELFPDAESFLAPAGGTGYAVTRAEGASLASLHLIRHRDGASMALDHSRPAYTNIVDYLS